MFSSLYFTFNRSKLLHLGNVWMYIDLGLFSPLWYSLYVKRRMCGICRGLELPVAFLVFVRRGYFPISGEIEKLVSPAQFYRFGYLGGQSQGVHSRPGKGKFRGRAPDGWATLEGVWTNNSGGVALPGSSGKATNCTEHRTSAAYRIHRSYSASGLPIRLTPRKVRQATV